ncbi:hypothetical protein Vadar_020867 [Vaccinium darrowii]|uniref:Uncharacterized protein n=1 Tax=Vaccinium darrowii TaxID=229202 RepID=A0ACB7Z593_9ERIC|nr:hypothetical protein Vadar_020867 [Vaccinium darrowii]
MTKKKKQVRRIKHYNSAQKIMLVGEGDLSFSACLATSFGSGHNMVATSLHSEGEPPTVFCSDSFQFLNFNPATTHDALYQGDASYNASVGAVEFNSFPHKFRIGWLTYGKKVQLWDSESGTLSDFTSNFSFTIDTLGAPLYGDGFAFFLAPVDFKIPPNSGGEFLGLFNTTTSNSEENQMVVVEFDTHPGVWDPPNRHRHIGINKNSISSIITAPWNTSLHSGAICDASITYNASTKNFSVFWSYGRGKSSSQGNSSLSYKLNLMEILPEWVMVGFSAATGELVERHMLESWTFSSSINTKMTSTAKQVEDTKLIVGITVSTGVFLIFATVILTRLVIIRKRRRRVRAEKTEKTNMTSINDDLERGAGPRSGRKSVDPTNRQSEIGLVEWVWELYGRGQILSAVDERVKSDFDLKEVECLVIVGLWCAYPDHNLRPSIRQAIQVLHFEAEMPHLPVKMPVPMYHVPGVGNSRPEELDGKRQEDGNNESGMRRSKKKKRDDKKLERVEAGLARARDLIRDVMTNQNRSSSPLDYSDYVPQGDIYRNAYAFHRYIVKCNMFTLPLRC